MITFVTQRNYSGFYMETKIVEGQEWKQGDQLVGYSSSQARKNEGLNKIVAVEGMESSQIKDAS